MRVRASSNESASGPSRPFFSRSVQSTLAATPFFTPAPGLAAPDVQAKEDLQELEEKRQSQEAPESALDAGAIGTPPPEEGTAPTVQPKLAIGSPGDRFEQEADAVAERVVQRMESGDIRGDRPPVVQAKCAACREDEEKLQRQTEPGDALPQARAEASSLAVPNSVQAALQGGGGGTGRALNPSLREEMEQAFAADFSGVHIHTGNAADSLNHDLIARAFTYGKDIFFNAREFRPETREGRHLLAHELTHVVQQTGAGSVANHVQRQPSKDKATYVPYQIQVTRPMTGAEFTAEVERQVFGRVINANWIHVKNSYDPSQSPVTARVHISRSAASPSMRRVVSRVRRNAPAHSSPHRNPTRSPR